MGVEVKANSREVLGPRCRERIQSCRDHRATICVNLREQGEQLIDGGVGGRVDESALTNQFRIAPEVWSKEIP
jgi:hypothetical protein